MDEQNGWFLPSTQPVQRLGLALEPWPDFDDWVIDERLDAVFLHRPWSLTDSQRRALQTANIGVLAYHLAFDERLTTGFNPALAAACGWGGPEVIGHKRGRPLGMVCALPAPASFEAVAASLNEQFGGLEEIRSPAAGEREMVGSVAVVGAMTDALVREAGARGARLYITGQWRQPVGAAVRETGLGVCTVGHRRSEQWGLRTLGRLAAQAAGADLEAVVHLA